jgi:hypothetical protein
MEVRPLRRGYYISRYSPGISIDSDNNIFNRLVIRAMAAACTYKIIFSAFVATGIKPLNSDKGFECQCQNIYAIKLSLCCSN